MAGILGRTMRGIHLRVDPSRWCSRARLCAPRGGGYQIDYFPGPCARPLSVSIILGAGEVSSEGHRRVATAAAAEEPVSSENGSYARIREGTQHSIARPPEQWGADAIGGEKESEEGGHVRRFPSDADRVHASFCYRKPVRIGGTTVVFFHPDDIHPTHLEYLQRFGTWGSNAIVLRR